jgi:uncharacterized protein YdaU (DUF1376 family)
MSALPYHKRYHSDALAGMMPLTLEERGAYNTILDMIYDRGGPLIDNERLLAGYMNCSIRKWRQIRESLLAKRKIRIDRDGCISNQRAEKEIENQSKTHRKLIEAGAKGGRARVENEKKANENSDGGEAELELTLSRPQAISEARSQNNASKEASQADPVKELFDMGIEVLGGAGVAAKNARSLIGRWRGQAGDDEVIAALVDAKAKSISQPVEWITKRLASVRKPSNGGGSSSGNGGGDYLQHVLDKVIPSLEGGRR